jgi:hypothetical protein
MTVIGAADARSDSHRNKQIFDVGTLRVCLSASTTVHRREREKEPEYTLHTLEIYVHPSITRVVILPLRHKRAQNTTLATDGPWGFVVFVQ